MTKSFQTSRARHPYAHQGKLLLLVVGILMVLISIGVSQVWLQHMTQLSYARIAKLEKDIQEQLRRTDILDSRIAMVQSPARMGRELARIQSPLRLPTPDQVIRVNATELQASIERQQHQTGDSALALLLSGRRENP
jgi:hypothetical protein